MVKKGKLPIFILILLILISLSLVGGVFYLFQKERAKNLALQDELEEVRTRQRITEAKLEESKKLVSSLEVKLQEAQKQMDQLNSNLEQEKAMKEEALVQIEQIKIDLEQQKVMRIDLESKLTWAQEDTKNMQKQLDELQSKKRELEMKIKELEVQTEQLKAQQAQGQQGVELGKIVVGTETAPKAKRVSKARVEKQEKGKPEKEKAKKKKAEVKKEEKKAEAVPQAAPATLEGKILVVNKDYDFVVINLGNRDNVATGDTFSIYHNNNYLGDITVEKVHDSMSAAGFVSSEIKNQVQEGDKVIPKTK